ncbi:MAG TPA: ABC transporter ATP-binding protein [Myxococcales bacterium]|nr:ABC transporter ATP-binding protein [Myxococcales bacterium]
MTAAPALEARGLRKAYGTLLAVDDLSFEVAPGEIVGILGPNGAGKTTALQLALRLLHPDAGEARLFGLDPEDLAARRRVGYAPDGAHFPPRMTGQALLELHCDLLAIPRSRAIALIGQLGLEEPARRPTGTYSRGQVQRLGLAQALLGEPDLLLLDEPTAGLDPMGVARIRAVLVELRGRGAAILLNSHLLSEVERVCDRVLFVKGGRLLRTHDVRGSMRHAEVRLANAPAVAARIAQAFPQGTLEGGRFRIAISGEEAMPAVVRELVALGGEIVEAAIKGAELEELYLQLVEGRA